MRNIYYFMGAALCALTISCAKEEAVVLEDAAVKLVPVTFSVDAQSTKTLLDYQNGKAVNWTSGDRVTIFDDKSGKIRQSFEVTYNNSSDSWELNAAVSVGAENFYALYPYNASAVISNNVVTTNIPSEQTAVAGSFGEEVNVSVAYTTTESMSLSFKNTCALLKLPIGMDNVASITITANGDCHMSGRSSITYNTETGAVSSVSCEGSHSVTLNGPLANGSTYFVAVAPQTYAGGITMTIVKTDGTVLVRKGTSNLVTSMGVIKPFSPITADGFTACDGYYGAYMAGMPLEICGEVLTYTTSDYVAQLDSDSAEGDTFDIGSALYEKNGIVFLKGTKPFVFSAAFKVKSGQRLVLVGDTPSVKTVIRKSTDIKHNMNAASASAYFKNISFSLTKTSSGANEYFIAQYGSLINRLFFDNCDISTDQSIFYTGSPAGANSLRITNCKIVPTSATVALFNVGNNTNMDKYLEIVFNNNRVYSSESRTFQIFATNASATASGDINCTAEVSNNIFYNVIFNDGLIRHYELKSAQLSGNIFYIPSSATNNNKVFKLLSATQSTSNLAKPSNYFYFGGDLTKNAKTFIYFYNEKTSPKIADQEVLTSIPEDPFVSFNTTTGVYELKPDYVGFGPQK